MRSTPAVLALVLLLLPAAAEAGPLGERPVWFGLGGAGGIGVVEDSALGYVNLTIGLRLIPVVPELTIREGIGADPKRHLTSIAAGARFLFPKLAVLRGSARIAFAHQHETRWEALLEDVPAGLFGTHEETVHRTGFEGGLGLDLMLDPNGIVGIWGQINALVFPATLGPPTYVLGELGVSFAVGPL